MAYIVVPGLDPALPDFNGVATDSRLDPSDAEFVDCIHTCGGLYGFYDPLCDLDFYPNRGQPVQPGCWFFHLVGMYSLIALNFYVPTGYSLLVRFEILKNVKRLLHCYCGFSWDLNPKLLVLLASKSLQATWQTVHSKINDYYLIKSHSRVHLHFKSSAFEILWNNREKLGCQDSFLCRPTAVFIF